MTNHVTRKADMMAVSNWEPRNEDDEMKDDLSNHEA